jgi:hypothetical protein
MSKHRKDIDLRGKKLDMEAVKLANEELKKSNQHLYDYTTRGVRKLTYDHRGYLYRKEWMNAYLKYSKIKTKEPIEVLMADIKWSQVKVTIKARWWPSPVVFTFGEALDEIKKCYEILDNAIEAHKRINSSWKTGYGIVSYLSELFGNVDLSEIITWSECGKGFIRLSEKAYNYHITEDRHIKAGCRAIHDAVKILNQIDQKLAEYRYGVEEGGEKCKWAIEITIDVLATLSSVGAVKLAGTALSNINKIKLAAEFVNKHRMLKVLAEAGKVGVEAGIKNTLTSSAELVSLYRSGVKVDWNKIISKGMSSFLKDFIKGGLDKIFYFKFLKPKFDKLIPSRLILYQKFGISLSKKLKESAWEYLMGCISNMGAEAFFTLLFKDVSKKTKHEKASGWHHLEHLAEEFLKFNLETVLKSARGV